jgi:putative endopeptidase
MTRKLSSLLALVLISCTVLAQQAATPDHHGIDTSWMDTSVKPGDDFYHFADGAWIKRTDIPADRSNMTIFGLLADRSDKRTAAIIENAAKSNPAPGSDARRIADLYASYLDEAAIESRGLESVKPHLAAIAAINTRAELARALGETLRSDVDALNNTNFHTANLFGVWVAPSFNDPDHYAPYLLQGGLELPDRDYYLATSGSMKSIRAAYQAHIAAMLRLAGFDNTDARATAILQLETSIAKGHISLADSENIEKANNTWKLSDFTAKAPGLDWTAYFRAAGLEKQPSFIVWQPSAFTAESALVASAPVDVWKDYLAYHFVEDYSANLPKTFADERFAMFGKTLTGALQMRPREQRAIALVNNLLGDAVGQLYAQRYFPPEAKAQAQAMVDNIMAAFRVRLAALPWMAPTTKAEALAKLGTLNVSVGYPDHWRSYADLDIKPGDLFGNVWRGSLFEYHYEVSRIGAPVDRKEWCMEPQTVNAVNLPLHNGLNFPAAILQPPFFDPEAPDAANYGAIGAVIGHEISHTFDSEGAAFDSKGRVRNWWTPADFAHFNASTAALAAQYDTYKPFSDLALNGRQTLGENIADVAGITAALDGYHASLHGKSAPVVAGFTGDQQFFISFAQYYASVFRDAALRSRVLTDPHSPGQYRASTVRNLDEWYAAFDVKPGDKLYLPPASRVHIW